MTAPGTGPESPLLAQASAGVLRLTLNRPAQFNALSDELMAALSAALDAAAADASVRAVVIAGAGPAFCAGQDLRELQGRAALDGGRRSFAACARLMLRLQALPQPVIARVHGVATAAGCQLVAACDLAVAADVARFGATGIHLGLFCSTPAVPLARNVLRKRAFELLVTGEFIDAHSAQAWGLVNRVVPLTELDAEVERLAQAIVAKPAAAVALGKATFYRQLEMGTAAAYQLAGQAMACHLAEPAAQTAIAAFLERRGAR